MKKCVLLITIAALLATAPAAKAADLAERFSLSVNPAGIFALGGNYTDSEQLKDAVNIGAGLEVKLRLKLHPNVFFNVGGGYFWMPMKDAFKPYAYRDKAPALLMPMISLDWMFYLKSGYQVEPYLRLGGFFSPWRFAANGLGAETMPALANPNEEFSGRSLGLNVALGTEIFAWRGISIFGEVRYNYLFSRNPEKFLTDDFTQQDFLSVNLGFFFYFK